MPPVRAGFLYVPVLAVDPGHRRRGIATRLLREVIEEAERAGGRGVALDVVADNRAAIALYESLGFGMVERRTIPPGRGLNHLSSLRMEFPIGDAPRGDG
jgi:ribosomal protein S18 acetylase RimI-like enzyme